MSTRQVTFLGTASQVPTRTRNHVGLFVQWDEFGLLIDPGEGTQRQMLHAGVSATQITHVLLTHFHGDHCLGLPGLLQRLSLDRVPHPIRVAYPASGQPFFERLRYASPYYETTTLLAHPLTVALGDETEVFRLGTTRLVARQLDHGMECLGYRLQEPDGRRMLPEKLAAAGVRGPAVGKLQREGAVEVNGGVVRVEEVSELRPGQSLAVVLDTRPCPAAYDLAGGADLLVCEATYLESEAQEAHDHYHMTARQAAEIARASGVRRLALTHFSQRYTAPLEHEREAGAVYPDVFVAEDLMRLSLPPRRGAAETD